MEKNKCEDMGKGYGKIMRNNQGIKGAENVKDPHDSRDGVMRLILEGGGGGVGVQR
jgi:hypothetical protein